MSRLGKRGSGKKQDGGTHEGGIKLVIQWGKRKKGGRSKDWISKQNKSGDIWEES